MPDDGVAHAEYGLHHVGGEVGFARGGLAHAQPGVQQLGLIAPVPIVGAHAQRRVHHRAARLLRRGQFEF